MGEKWVKNVEDKATQPVDCREADFCNSYVTQVTDSARGKSEAKT